MPDTPDTHPLQYQLVAVYAMIESQSITSQSLMICANWTVCISIISFPSRRSGINTKGKKYIRYCSEI